jgi:RHS repeat-associated protein
VKNLAILAEIDTQRQQISDTLRIFEERVGAKNYELSNHLGNVLATIGDKTIFNTDHYNSIVYSAQLYYPFGWEIPTLSYTAKKYRFGFNGKEDDREWHAQDYGFRLYTPRESRFISVDPITAQYPWYTPYQFAGNKPIAAVDLDGLEEWIMISGYVKSATLYGPFSINYIDSKKDRLRRVDKAQQKGQEVSDIVTAKNIQLDYPLHNPIVPLLPVGETELFYIDEFSFNNAIVTSPPQNKIIIYRTAIERINGELIEEKALDRTVGIILHEYNAHFVENIFQFIEQDPAPQNFIIEDMSYLYPEGTPASIRYVIAAEPIQSKNGIKQELNGHGLEIKLNELGYLTLPLFELEKERKKFLDYKNKLDNYDRQPIKTLQEARKELEEIIKNDK